MTMLTNSVDEIFAVISIWTLLSLVICNNNTCYLFVPGLHSGNNNGVRKYVMCCLLCGGMSAILGVLFLGVYFLLRSYTSTVGYFETVPTFVPATLVSPKEEFLWTRESCQAHDRRWNEFLNRNVNRVIFSNL